MTHPRVAFALTSLASCSVAQRSPRKLKKAISMLERSIAIIQSKINQNAIELAENGGPLPVKAKVFTFFLL